MKELNGMKKKEVSIEAIVIDGGTQFRAKANEQRVQDYSEMLGEDGWPFDSACDVFHDGTSHYLVDGFHRYLAAKRVGRKSITCQIHIGSLRDAIKFALSANSRHGLHRSNEDKRKAVEFALTDKEWGKLSDRALAELCGVSHPFVMSVRSQVVTVTTCEQKESPETRTGKDGKEYPASQPKAAKPEPEYEDVADDEPAPAPKTKKQSKVEEALKNARHIGAVRQLVYGLITAMKAVAVVNGTELYHARLKRLLQLVEPLPAAIKACEPYKICGHCNGKGCPQCGNHGWVSSSVKE